MDINNTKISIITINKNNKNGLEKTIQSVISQTYFDRIDFIVIDGNSKDGSKEVLDPSLYYCVSEPDLGIFNAMNKGIEQSNSDYCLFLNSGDYLISNTIIEEIYYLLDTIDVISFPYIYYPSGILRKTIPCERLLNSFFSRTLPHHSTFIKTSLLKDRLYDESFEIMGDADLFFDLLIIKKCSYITYDNIISYVDDSGVSKRKEYEIRLERNKMLSKYSDQLNNPIINNYLKRNNIDKIYIAIIEYDKLTTASINSIKNQSYSNIEICDLKQIENLNSIFFIMINYDAILPKDYIKDLYNLFIFNHSFNRHTEQSYNYELNTLYFKRIKN